MFCTKCGTALPSGSIRCRLCRTPVTGAAPVAPRVAGGASTAAAFERPGLITFLAILHFFAAGMMVLVLLVMFTLSKDNNAIPLQFSLLFVALAILHFFAGLGLWKLKAYGRTTEIVLCVFGLFAVPLGTLISILLLIYLNKPGVQVLFSEKSENELTPADHAALYELKNSGSPVVVIAICALIGFVVVAILAAIAIPNLLTAMQRAKQKRTMADMVEFARQMNAYAEANHRLPLGQTVSDAGNAIHANVRVDGWGHELRYINDGEGYWLISAGKDGRFQHERPGDYKQGEVSGFDADIVMHNSEWVQVPEGVITSRR